MFLERILDLLRSGREWGTPALAPPGPANDFTHRENESLFVRCKKDSQVAAPDKDPLYTMGGYDLRAHSDLIPMLYDLISDSEVRKGSAYGWPVMANHRGLVFAYAGGTHYIFLKLREDRHDAARLDGGRWDPAYGSDWIEFRIGGRTGGPPDWQEALRRWSRISYQDSLNIE